MVNNSFSLAFDIGLMETKGCEQWPEDRSSFNFDHTIKKENKITII